MSENGTPPEVVAELKTTEDDARATATRPDALPTEQTLEPATDTDADKTVAKSSQDSQATEQMAKINSATVRKKYNETLRLIADIPGATAAIHTKPGEGEEPEVVEVVDIVIPPEYEDFFKKRKREFYATGKLTSFSDPITDKTA